MSTRSTFPPGWLVALLLLLAFALQGTRGVWEPDEGRYTAVALNMLDTGDWLVPRIDGDRPHLTKPPITYWALATGIAAFGHNEWAVRLPAALAFVGTGCVLFGLGRRLLPQRPWLPALIWSLSFAPMMAANIVSTDPLLVVFEAAAMFAFVEAWAAPAARRRGWIRAMWIGFGLAFMTKGPPGLLPLLGIVVFTTLADRRLLRQLFDPLGLLGFCVTAFAWFAVLVAQDPDRLQYFLGYEVYDRVFTGRHDRNAQWYGGLLIYLPMLLLGALPWWIFAILAAGGPRATWSALRARISARDPGWLLLACWFFVPLAVFFLARARLQLYVLPLFVPLSLMLAQPVSGWPWLTPRRLLAVAATTAVALLGLKATLAYWPSNRDARAMAAAISGAIDLRPIDEITFVGMRPFYGLQLYLGLQVEGIQIDEHRYEYSKFVAAEDLCEEIAGRERNVYALKASREQAFVDAVRRCGSADIGRIGQFEADDNLIAMYRAR